MFVFNRSAFAVILPLALLVAVVLWSNRDEPVANIVRATPAGATTMAQVDPPRDENGG